MKARARWPLAAVLALAVREETLAARALADALAAQGWRRRERDDAAEALSAHRSVEAAAEGRTAPAGASVASLGAAALHRAALRAEGARRAAHLGGRAEALAAARREVAARQAALAGARAAVGALERHRAGWRAERARGRARAEDAAADDLVSAAPRPGSWRVPRCTRP